MPRLVPPLALLLFLVVATPSLRSPSAPPPLVVRDVTLIDATGAEPFEHTTVVVLDGRIAAIGPEGSVATPPGAREIDGGGKFLIPGLWDMHVHAMREGRSLWHFPLYLAHGVTSVREMGTFLDSLDTWRGRSAAGAVLGPRIVAAGHIVDGPPPAGGASPPPDQPTPAWVFALHVERPDQAESVVDSLVRRGVDFVKVYSGLSRAVYFAIAEAAKARGIPFAGHVPGSVSVVEAADAGQRSIEHLTGMTDACIPGFRDFEREYGALLEARLPPDSLRAAELELVHRTLASYSPESCSAVFERFIANGTRHVPTLVIPLGLSRLSDPAAANDPRRRYVPDKILARWQPRDDVDPETMRAILESQLRMVGDMHRAGVFILAGTDASDETYVFPGSSLHEELALLVEAGFSPLAAIQAATWEPARFLAMDDSLGTIEVGKRADLVVLEANPLQDIRNTNRIRAVVLDGRLFDRNDLDALLRQAEEAARRE